MHYPPFPLNIGIECPSESLLKLGLPYMRWFLASVQEHLKNLIGFSYIDGVLDTNTLIVVFN